MTDKQALFHSIYLSFSAVSLLNQFFLSLIKSKSLQLDIIPASVPGSEVKLRDAAHELNEEKRKSARRKE